MIALRAKSTSRIASGVRPGLNVSSASSSPEVLESRLSNAASIRRAKGGRAFSNSSKQSSALTASSATGRKGRPNSHSSSEIRRIRVDETEISELLASRTIANDVEMIIKVKKPDFLGNSMWKFNHEGHPITASILDLGWFAEFRKDGLGVRPGVALRALVRIEASYDDDNEALPPRYAILRVFEVIPPKLPTEQLYLPTHSPDRS